MHFDIKKSSKKPLYQQIIESIEEALIAGKLLPGEKLPSERELSHFFSVNRSTVVRAMDELHERRLIIRKVGSGTYINPQKWGQFSKPRLQWNGALNKEIFQHPVKYNLTNGDLPTELYPSLQLPEIDWQLLLEAEREQESMRLGTIDLREAVQRYLQRSHQWNVPIEEIMITSGTQQALSLIALGLLKSGDSIAIENPSYFYSLSIFQALGIRIYGIPMDREGIIISKLDQLLHKHRIKMIFINPVFHNPTGRVISLKRKELLISYCHRKQLPIVEDDAYGQLKFYNYIDNTPLKMASKGDNIFYLGSLSKYLGRSIRIGWMIAPRSIIENLANIRQQLDSGLSSLPQYMAQHYLDHYASRHEVELQRTLKIKADQFTNWLDYNLSDLFNYERPQGGFHLFAELKMERSQKEIEKRLSDLEIRGIEDSYFGGDGLAYRFSFPHFSIPQ